MAIMEVNNLCMFFGGVKAVSDINMRIRGGDIIGIIGPNGAGKTTFFNLLTGIYRPTSGEILFHFDRSISSKQFKPHRMTQYGVGRTFQNIRLFKEMTVIENVLMGYHKNISYGFLPSLLRLPSFYRKEEEAYRDCLRLLEIFNLDHKKDELAKNLPYGEQRKLEIARALASRPKLLLLDEPAAGMNPNETRELTKLIRWVKDRFELTVFLIEHDMRLVMGLCHRILVLDYGITIAEGTPAEIQGNRTVVEAYLGEEAL